MERKTKLELGAAAVCAAVVGVSVFASSAEDNDSRIMVEDKPASTTSQTTSAPVEQDVILGSVLDTVKLYSGSGKSFDITVSFTAAPDKMLSTSEKLVFVSDDPPVTVIASADKDYTTFSVVTVNGTISDIQGYSITLEDCTISAAQAMDTDRQPSRIPQTQKSEAVSPPVTTAVSTTKTTSSPQETDQTPVESTPAHSDSVGASVYVSSSGKYHSKPNCSGMKNYTEMTYSEAVAKNCVPCQKCFG
ncbi:MAG: hypothetical protein IJO91_06520 [Oscillospiraceae bacterium]|nr:hypothetical protein [Oscillospiraceae bacterium]